MTRLLAFLWFAGLCLFLSIIGVTLWLGSVGRCRRCNGCLYTGALDRCSNRDVDDRNLYALGFRSGALGSLCRLAFVVSRLMLMFALAKLSIYGGLGGRLMIVETAIAGLIG
jgi:hypothetical protein